MPAPAKATDILPLGRRIVHMVALNNSRLVVLCDDHTLWQRVLDPTNMTGGEKHIWVRIEGPPATE